MSSSSSSSSSSCAYFSEKRKRCHEVYGTLGEDCLAEELQEKRCLSLRHCPSDAQKYYGSQLEGLPKALCSSWAEAFAFASTANNSDGNNIGDIINNTNATGGLQELHHGSAFVEHHNKAQKYVNDRPKLKSECRQIARDLARCLRTAGVSRR